MHPVLSLGSSECIAGFDIRTSAARTQSTQILGNSPSPASSPPEFRLVRCQISPQSSPGIHRPRQQARRTCLRRFGILLSSGIGGRETVCHRRGLNFPSHQSLKTNYDARMLTSKFARCLANIRLDITFQTLRGWGSRPSWGLRAKRGDPRVHANTNRHERQGVPR